MKRSTIVFGIAIIALFSIPVMAQHMGYHSHQGNSAKSDSTWGMMGNQGMMQGNMMNNQGYMHNGQMGYGQGMYQNNQMGNMMYNYPMMRNTMMLINRLPQMQTELSLSDKQVKKLQNMQDKFNQEQNDQNSLIVKKQTALNAAIENNAPVTKFRQAYKDLQDVRADMAVRAYEAGQKMRAVLNTTQQKELQSTMPGYMMSNRVNS